MPAALPKTKWRTGDQRYALPYRAEKCPAGPKSARVRTSAETLVKNDGPAVNMMVKLFGEETMRRIVLKHMYGIE